MTCPGPHAVRVDVAGPDAEGTASRGLGGRAASETGCPDEDGPSGSSAMADAGDGAAAASPGAAGRRAHYARWLIAPWKDSGPGSCIVSA